jgi:hypothetical protein
LEQQIGLRLQPRETLALAQFLKFLVPEDRIPHVSRRFLMDFAMVFLHQIGENGSPNDSNQMEEVSVTEEDVLNLRELVPVSATMGSTPVGVLLHRKLYEAILRFHPEQASELRFAEVDEPSKENLADELNRLKRRFKRYRA